MMVILQLGGVTLEGFEVPGRVRLGGSQSLAVHKLPGGVRIIDAMGRDDGDLSWSGIMSGADAGDRARLLDAMRAAGSLLPLSWDSFFYSVVIRNLQLDYRSPWWIEYRITCTVQQDQAQAEATVAISTEAALAADLATAGAYVDVSQAAAATSVSGALTVGTAAAAAAALSLSAVQASISQGIATAEGALLSDDLTTAVNASGTLAQLCSAQGFVSRAANNLAQADS